MKTLIATVIIGLAVSSSLGQSIQSTNYDGGAIVINYAYDIKINAQSTLRRNWHVLNDPSCPVQLGKVGVFPMYRNNEFQFLQTGSMTVTQEVKAVEIRHVLYDVFGNHVITLSSVQIADLTAGNPIKLTDSIWRAWEGDATQFLDGVAFVASVRIADGNVWRHNQKAITEEFDKIFLKVSDEALKPKKKE